MNASVLDEQGKALTMFMGCYGIGVTRGGGWRAVEQNHDWQRDHRASSLQVGKDGRDLERGG